MSVHLITTELAEGGSSGIGAFVYFYDLSHFRPLTQGHHPIVFNLIVAFQPTSGRLTHHDSGHRQRRDTNANIKLFYLFLNIAQSTS